MANRVLFCAAVLLSATPSWADVDLSGHWTGSIKVPGRALEIELDFARADSGWSGTISIPIQGLVDHPLRDIVDGEQIRFALADHPRKIPAIRRSVARCRKTGSRSPATSLKVVRRSPSSVARDRIA